MSRAALSRLEREADRRREAAKCATEPHPPERQFWSMGDWATPDRRICGRCFTTLELRWPSRREGRAG